MGVLRIMPNGVGPYGVWTNIWDVDCPGDGYADAQEAVDYIANAYLDYWRPLAKNSFNVLTWKCAALGTLLPSVDITATAGAVVGALTTGDVLPTQIALLLRFSAVAARPNRARKYITGLTEANWSEVTWSAAVGSAGQNWVNEMLAMEANTLSGLKFGVARRPIGFGAVTFVPLTAGSIDGYAVTQRRRRRKT